MNHIVTGIHDVATNMTQISFSSSEQSTGIGEITTAIRQLDEITQRNATMVEHAAMKALDMKSRAQILVDSVSAFKLVQGSPDEAIALVSRAVSLSQQVGREKFLRDITDSSQGFFDRDMYVFVLDKSGRYIAFAGNTSKVGSRVQDIAGIEGQELLETIIRQASQEPGWVEYEIFNPITGNVQSKMSYVYAVEDMFLGCGVYKNFDLS